MFQVPPAFQPAIVGLLSPALPVDRRQCLDRIGRRVQERRGAPATPKASLVPGTPRAGP
jgi:hypothetical protein